MNKKKDYTEKTFIKSYIKVINPWNKKPITIGDFIAMIYINLVAILILEIVITLLKIFN